MRARHRRAAHGLLKLLGGAVLGGLLAYAGTPSTTAIYIMLVVLAVVAIGAVYAESTGALVAGEVALSTTLLIMAGMVMALWAAT